MVVIKNNTSTPKIQNDAVNVLQSSILPQMFFFREIECNIEPGSKTTCSASSPTGALENKISYDSS